MTKVKRTGSCGNSPKNKFVEGFSIAFCTADLEFLNEHITDDIEWHIVGEKIISGKQDFIEAVKARMEPLPPELNILHITQHGRTGAADGQLKFKNSIREFCNIYEFGSVKGIDMKLIRSYILDT